MNRFISKKVLPFGLILFFGLVCQAQTSSTETRYNPITTAVPFLTITPDSRHGAMGDVGAATSPDANAQYWNPSKLAFAEEKFGISLSFTPWLRQLVSDVNLAYLAASSLVVKPSEDWPDKFLLLDYSPQWQEFGKHSENDSLDQFVTANAVWPMAKLILGVQENYSDQKATIVEASTRSEIQQNHTELDAGYRLNDNCCDLLRITNKQFLHRIQVVIPCCECIFCCSGCDTR